jgi:hypothetical protein
MVVQRSCICIFKGRPVLAQDTGLKGHYPTDRGLILFSTLDEARAGIDELVSNYSHHALAAREIAETIFDSDKVLRQLLSRLGVL